MLRVVAGKTPDGTKAMRILLAAIILIFGVGAATAPALADGGGTNTGGNYSKTCSGNNC
jgi:hypothetical protein